MSKLLFGGKKKADPVMAAEPQEKAKWEPIITPLSGDNPSARNNIGRRRGRPGQQGATLIGDSGSPYYSSWAQKRFSLG